MDRMTGFDPVDEGSNPSNTSKMEVIRLDEELVLKTSSVTALWVRVLPLPQIGGVIRNWYRSGLEPRSSEYLVCEFESHLLRQMEVIVIRVSPPPAKRVTRYFGYVSSTLTSANKVP
jgi:hypothetical protein